MGSHCGRLVRVMPISGSHSGSTLDHSHCVWRQCSAARVVPVAVSTLVALLAVIPASARADQFVQIDYILQFPGLRSRDTVFFELFDDKPQNTANFLQYVNSNDFNASIMHRLARNFVLQGGGYYPRVLATPQNQISSLDPTFTV